MTLFDVADPSPTLPRWTHSTVQDLGDPTILYNNSGAVLNGVPTGFLLVHPGVSTYVVLRFTVPTSANYSLLAQALVGDFGDTDMNVLRNSNAGSPLFFAPTTDTNPSFNSTLALTAGDTVDLVVGNKGDFHFDSTGAVFTLTNVGSGSSAPEPGSIALFSTGGLIWIIRARRWRWRRSPGSSASGPLHVVEGTIGHEEPHLGAGHAPAQPV